MMYALQGPSQAAKTSFVKSLFRKPFVVTLQGEDTLDLRGFRYGEHDALVTWQQSSPSFVASSRRGNSFK